MEAPSSQRTQFRDAERYAFRLGEVRSALPTAGGPELGSLCKTGAAWSGMKPRESRPLLTWLLVDPFAEPEARSPSILINEFDAGGFESTPYDMDRREAWSAYACFELMHRHDSDSSGLRKVHLTPAQESSSRSTLGRCDHASYDE